VNRSEDIPQDVWDAAEAVETDINGPDHSAYSHAAIARAIMAERAKYADLLQALKVLADEADNFSVSGVYFNEPCMGHKGLELAYAAIAKAEGR
jgi:hypothetical protein